MEKFNATDIINSLETKSWYFNESFVSKELTQTILHEAKEQLSLFKPAGIGSGESQKLNGEIRQSLTCWIENWHTSKGLDALHQILSRQLQLLKEEFFLPLKRFESQLAYYPEGGFYKKHLDQHKGTQNRLITSLFYLNDCTEGGELVIYNKNDPSLVDATIKPKAGSFVTFISKDIYHEVKPTRSERYSLTTWIRNDDDLPY